MAQSRRAAAHVYVVEDDQDVRASIAEILHDEGYDVREFEDGGAALFALREGARPCLVLLDLNMPAMSGENLAETIRADSALRAIPIVIITGAALSPPGYPCLQKPFALTDLMAVAERHCGHRDPGGGAAAV
jgi:two-component system, chemotaxis family, chemotaxis protein CheY